VTPRDRLEAILSAALRAVDPGEAVGRALEHEAPPDGSVLVVALGKAACGMAARLETLWGDRIRGGLAVTKDGHALALRRIEVRETGHPVPDARCEVASREALALVRNARPDESLWVLLSGGTSALTACPPQGLGLSDVAATTRALLASGADIGEMNAVRKHLSEFSGGRLACAAASSRIEVLAISDVLGDALDVIGSGPCAPDPTTYGDALDVIARRNLEDAIPGVVLEHLRRGVSGGEDESPGPGDPLFDRVRHRVIAGNCDARAAARVAAGELGLEARDLGEILSGEARDVGRELVRLAERESGGAPRCLIAGGETTVTLAGDGVGGRNQELALAAALELADSSRADLARANFVQADFVQAREISLLAAGTDGTDGPTDAAGAFVDAGSVDRGASCGVDARAALAANDSHGFFSREGGLVVTGPTGTNVMDLALVELS
jgi:glycerate 2-kinase